MIFHFTNSRTLLLAGMGALAIANTWHWLAQRVWHLSESIADGGFGLMMGAAFALLLLSIVASRRNKATRNDQ